MVIIDIQYYEAVVKENWLETHVEVKRDDKSVYLAKKGSEEAKAVEAPDPKKRVAPEDTQTAPKKKQTKRDTSKPKVKKGIVPKKK